MASNTNLFAEYNKIQRNRAAGAQPVFGAAQRAGAPMSAERAALLASLPQAQQQRSFTFVPATGTQSGKPMSAERAALYASLKNKKGGKRKRITKKYKKSRSKTSKRRV